MIQPYSILINTCDKFEDCWDPFFKLWIKYWTNCRADVYLNTEYKDYHYPGLDVKALKVCEINNYPPKKRATWSQCFRWALEQIDTEIVLYMQEDYFLKAPVKNEIVEKYAELINSDSSIRCIHITDQSVAAIGKSRFEHLNNVAIKQRYRVSCQAALWRKEELLGLIRDYEDAWQFEEFGSQRSAIMKNNYYVVDNNWVQLNRFEIIPYIFTGIVQGRWNEQVIPLFKEHEINIDFTKRGMLKDAPAKSFIKRVKYRINRIPKTIHHIKDLNQLKKSEK